MRFAPAILAAVLSAALSVALGAEPVHAQPLTAPAAPDPADRSVVLDELVVTARPRGPAMWKASKGAGEVVVLGSVAPLPHQPPWDTRRLERQMEGARQVLLPPSGQVSGLGAASMFLTQSRLKLGRGQTLSGTLPPNLRARYLETIGLFGLDQRRYDGWKPAAAGFLMLSDMREKAGLSSAKPGSTVERLAKARRVTVRYVGSGSVVALFNGAKQLSDAQQGRCLSDALDEIDREADFARPVAAAWAAGDLESVRRSYPAPVMEACLLQLPSYQGLIARGVDEAVAELERAMAAPGRTIAVIDLNYLIRRGGVLDRLRADGAQITVPLGGEDPAP